ncbi:MAG: hypothetical protein IPM18_10365 [Phycisphaerales bacterium]|nr:hypothetical protein [Phycisphaerales bacterium]
MRRLALLGTVLCCSTLVFADVPGASTARRAPAQPGGVDAQATRNSPDFKDREADVWQSKPGEPVLFAAPNATALSVPEYSARAGGFVQFLTGSSGADPRPGGDRACNHRIVLEDSYGDGWTNDSGVPVNFVEVFVNGNSVGSYTMTVADGRGPLFINFSADTGDTITTVFTPNAAGYPSECSYYILDTFDNVLCTQGFGGTVPGDCNVTGQCTTNPCTPPANNSCATATAVNGPFPQVVAGNNTCAAYQCPGVLNWKATWLAINLPYASNNVTLDFCQPGSPPVWGTVGIAYYTSCADCSAFQTFTAAFPTCGGGTAPRLTASNLVGPGTIYVPIWGKTDTGFLEAYEVEVNVVNAATSYCASNATSTADSLIEQVTVGSFVNYSGINPVAYSDFTAIGPINLTVGSPTAVEVITNNATTSGCYAKQVKIWIDINKNFVFDANELVYSGGHVGGTGNCPFILSGTLTVPPGALTGTTRMRVVCRETSDASLVLPCGTYTWGETEDYTVNIVAAAPLGACCLGATCDDNNGAGITEAACLTAGGIYKGDGSRCDPVNPCVGACCLPTGGCVETTPADCGASSGTYGGDGTSCASTPCPYASTCDTAIAIPAAPFSYFFNNDLGPPSPPSPSCNSTSATVTQNAAWFVFTATEAGLATASMTQSYDALIAAYTGPDCNNLVELGCGDIFIGGVNTESVTFGVSAGQTYWLLLGDWGVSEGGGPTLFEFDLQSGTGGCCLRIGTCVVTDPADCLAQGGTYLGSGAGCEPNPCPQPNVGDICDLPIEITIDGSFSGYADTNQTTCGRGNDIDDSCLGSYDGGEDIVYRLTVTQPTCVDILIQSNVASEGWLGFAINDQCLGTPCLYGATSGSATQALFEGVGLPAGTYYLVVDTWPTPNCLADFDIYIVPSGLCEVGACCLGGNCTDAVFPVDCFLQGGTYLGTGTSCAGFDCNNNGLDDACEIAENPALDCNNNGILDVCEIALDPTLDADGNGVLDECDLDCNGNGIPDGCDVNATPLCQTKYGAANVGLSNDCQPDGIPDECQLGAVPIQNVVADGSFEGGSPNASWAEASSNFGSPLCTRALCTSNPAFNPQDGLWWAWFGGIEGVSETGSLEQVVTIPAQPPALLTFYLQIPNASGNGVDFFTASIDGNVVFSALESDAPSYAEYTLVTVDVSAYANGGTHTLRFDSTTTGTGLTNFFLDNVALGVVIGPPANDQNQNGVPDDCESAPQVCPGDSNGDTFVNFADISPFIAAIKAGNAGNWTCNLAAGFGPYLNSDANGDGVVNFADISPFIALLKAPPAPCVSVCP